AHDWADWLCEKLARGRSQIASHTASQIMQQRSLRTPASLPELPTPRMHSGMRAGSVQHPQTANPRAYADDAHARRRPVSQPVLRSQPTAETADALRSLLDDHLSTVVATAEAEQQAKEKREAEARAAAIARAQAEARARAQAEAV